MPSILASTTATRSTRHSRSTRQHHNKGPREVHQQQKKALRRSAGSSTNRVDFAGAGARCCNSCALSDVFYSHARSVAIWCRGKCARKAHQRSPRICAPSVRRVSLRGPCRETQRRRSRWVHSATAESRQAMSGDEDVDNCYDIEYVHGYDAPLVTTTTITRQLRAMAASVLPWPL